MNGSLQFCCVFRTMSARLAGALAKRTIGALLALAMVGSLLGVTTSSAEAATAVRATSISQHRLAEAVALIRKRDRALAHESTKQLDKMLITLVRSAERSSAATSAHMRFDLGGASHTGHTIWISKWTVALWAAAATAVVIAALVILGVPGLTAAGAVWALIGVFWTAAAMRECAWFTYSSPRSMGTYSC